MEKYRKVICVKVGVKIIPNQLNRRWPPEKRDCKNVTKTVVVICSLKQSGIVLLQSITIRPEITYLNDEAMTGASRTC